MQMEKHIYIIRGMKDESYASFTKRIHNACRLTANDNGVSKVTATLTVRKPPPVSVIPFRNKKIAAISVFMNGGATPVHFLSEPGFSGAYAVEEALPRAYRKTWQNGEPTPGVCLLTLFRKNNKVDRKVFLDRWHNGHTPLTLKVHPVWHYNRNVVLKTLTEGSEGHDGIVEEHFIRRAELLNPAIFFGNLIAMPWNMLRVYLDVKSFLDYKTTEPFLVREYHYK